MNYCETMEYLQSLQKFGMRLGLHRIRALLQHMGNPQESLPTIHIGGTNGKGSVSAMLTAILTEAGYRVGTYISPALHHFGERITVQGQPIPHEDLASIISELKPLAAQIGHDGDHPTEFEIVTAAAFIYFCREAVDMVVLEVGLGGRLDSTNVMDKPLVSVITNVGFDHMDILGSSLPEIAKEKAGIIKKGRPVVTGTTVPEALQVIQHCALDQTAPLYVLGQDIFLEHVDMDWTGEKIQATTMDSHYEDLTIPLLGEHQAKNAALVLAVVDLLCRDGYPISAQAVRSGIAKTKWPARFEVVQQQPVVIIDGAHNPDGMEALGKTIQKLAYGRRVFMVLGILADKDWQTMAAEAVRFTEMIIAVTPHSPRGLAGDRLCEYIKSLGHKAVFFESVQQGIQHARKVSGPEDIVCAAGSFVTAAEARILFL
jgi:dihydrofolate synthase / folylpolyglutamate synthase